MKYFILEACRRFVQMIFGLSIFEFPVLREIRMIMYRLVFNIKGKPSYISNHVIFFRAHNIKNSDCKVGNISIGKHCGISSDVQIDYSGDIQMGDYVWLSEGCKIFTHTHMLQPNRIYRTSDSIIPNKLVIGDYAWLGANSIILPGVNYIGSNSVIGGGAVCTHDVPDNVVVAGNPARIIRELTEDEIAIIKESVN